MANKANKNTPPMTIPVILGTLEEDESDDVDEPLSLDADESDDGDFCDGE